MQHNKMVNQKLLTFVKKKLNEGLNKKMIENQLLQQGWNIMEIDSALELVKKASKTSEEKISPEEQKSKVYCWNCSKENEATAGFCNRCGVDLKKPLGKKEEVSEEKKEETTKIDMSEEVKKGLIKKEEFDNMRKGFALICAIFGGGAYFLLDKLLDIRGWKGFWIFLGMVFVSAIIGFALGEVIAKKYAEQKYNKK